jgi:ABC-type glycerol-3-phosphate transport system substrate-binding protein
MGRNISCAKIARLNLISLTACCMVLGSCFSPPPPLSPSDALAEADRIINAILDDERSHLQQQSVKATPNATPSSTVSVWYFRHPLMGPALSDGPLRETFSKENPDVTLDARYAGDWPVAVNKYMTALAAHDEPDIAVVDHAWLAQLAAAGRLADLNTLLPADFIADLRGPARRAGERDGHLFALPADGFCENVDRCKRKLGGHDHTLWIVWLPFPVIRPRR